MMPTTRRPPSETDWMPPKSIWIGTLVVAIIFCTQFPGDERPLHILLGIVSLLTLAGWVLVAVVGREMNSRDEADAYDVGADSGGVVIFVPAGLTLLWISVFVVVAVSRLLLQQPMVTDSLRLDALVFAGATVFGILLCMLCSTLCAKRGVLLED
mmetsp:Transcript_9693/g.25775  ORF Transcript_9693/g.25775 Transcript_9693/m.25775 type:complete len:155 (+) Transcript_9693:40-504(+)